MENGKIKIQQTFVVDVNELDHVSEAELLLEEKIRSFHKKAMKEIIKKKKELKSQNVWQRIKVLFGMVLRKFKSY